MWADQSEQTGLQKSGLKETGAKTEHFRQRGNSVLQRKLMWFLSIKSCNPILIVTQNTILNLEICIICPFNILHVFTFNQKLYMQQTSKTVKIFCLACSSNTIRYDMIRYDTIWYDILYCPVQVNLSWTQQLRHKCLDSHNDNKQYIISHTITDKYITVLHISHNITQTYTIHK